MADQAILKGNAAFLHKGAIKEIHRDRETKTGRACDGLQASQVLGRNYDYSVMVASVQNSLSVVRGFVNGVGVDIMLNSGSSVSLLRQDIVSQMEKVVQIFPQSQPKLVTASGDPLHIVDYVRATVMINDLCGQ